MWGRFHERRTPSHFHKKWKVFLSASIGNFPFTFFQYVTDSLFKVILARFFPHYFFISSSASSPSPLSPEEQNALRWQVHDRNIAKEYKKNANNNISNVEVLLLYSFSGDKATDNITESWTNSLDRGVLRFSLSSVLFI